jgi:hypothetical protein
MAYTVRIHIQVRNTRRILKTFLRPEYAVNTSSHANRYESLEAAENAADEAIEHFRAAGHTYICSDFYRVD